MVDAIVAGGASVVVLKLKKSIYGILVFLRVGWFLSYETVYLVFLTATFFLVRTCMTK